MNDLFHCSWCRRWFDADGFVAAPAEPIPPMSISHGICTPCMQAFHEVIQPAPEPQLSFKEGAV